MSKDDCCSNIPHQIDNIYIANVDNLGNPLGECHEVKHSLDPLKESGITHEITFKIGDMPEENKKLWDHINDPRNQFYLDNNGNMYNVATGECEGNINDKYPDLLTLDDLK